MIFFFFDESGDCDPTTPKNPKHNPSTYFVISAIAVELERLQVFISRRVGLKKRFFGEEKYQRSHPEIKASSLFGKSGIKNKERQQFANASALLLQELNPTVFAVVLDKRKARIFNQPTSSNVKYKPWFYGIGIQHLLVPISHFIETRYEDEKGLLVFDSSTIEKEISEGILTYLLGNIRGKELTNIIKFPLYGISHHVELIQWADFVAGTVRFWFEYECGDIYNAPKRNRKILSKAYQIVRRLVYFSRQENADGTTQTVDGFIIPF